MKGIAFFFLCAFSSLSVAAQISITASSLTYTQDFNTLDSAGTSQTTMPPGWSFYEWGGSSANTTYRVSTGSSTTGDTYSFGATNSRERALGSLCSSGVPNVSYGVRFVNNTAAYINAVTVTFKEEQWRRGGTGNTDSVRFYYTTATGSTIADTSFSLWNQVPALLMTSITTASPASAINGNDTAKVMTAMIPVELRAGDTISIRWYDYNSGGSDDGLAIDSLTAIFNIGPPSALYKPAVSSFSPASGNTNVAPGTGSLVITFDRNIVKGNSGNIYLKNRATQAVQTIPVSAVNVTVSGRVTTIANVNLQTRTTYHVTFDSTAFDSSGFHSAGLYDTTAWSFRTFAEGIGGISWASVLPISVVNPASDGVFSLRCDMPREAILTITIYDLAGRKVARHFYYAAKGENHFMLCEALPDGTYIIRVDDGKQWGSVKATMQ